MRFGALPRARVSRRLAQSHSLGALRRTFLALSATPYRRPQTANAAALQTQARACRGYSGGSGTYRMTMPGHAAPVVPASASFPAPITSEANQEAQRC